MSDTVEDMLNSELSTANGSGGERSSAAAGGGICGRRVLLLDVSRYTNARQAFGRGRRAMSSLSIRRDAGKDIPTGERTKPRLCYRHYIRARAFCQLPASSQTDLPLAK